LPTNHWVVSAFRPFARFLMKLLRIHRILITALATAAVVALFVAVTSAAAGSLDASSGGHQVRASYDGDEWWWWDDGDPGATPPTGSTGQTGPTGPTTPAPPTEVIGDPNAPPTPNGQVARLARNGRTAIAPKRSPRVVKDLIHAANRLTRKPYLWGGGHGSFNARGYDCSGATSYVLHAAGLVNTTMVSGQYRTWGLKGLGKWVSVFANKGHVFVYIAGLRFDTSGRGEHGPRWRVEPRWVDKFKVRHPAGL
jgi:cell wall-associated NlpC family hydrolase